MSEQDDLPRYIEYLQRALSTEGWEKVFDPTEYKRWHSKKANISRIEAYANEAGFDRSLVQELENAATNFVAATKYDHPETHTIFGPILEDVKKAADGLGLKPTQNIILASSTDVSLTPSARPQDGLHLLFIGRGTSAFCNYWAKAIAAAVTGIVQDDSQKRFNTEAEVRMAIAANPRPSILSVQLSTYYAFFGTLLGFGEVVQPKELLQLRTDLLHAMEVFVVAHEYAHFVAEERIPEFRGQLDRGTSHKLEMFCDELGLQICREVANVNESSFEFTGVGPIVFLRAVDICTAVNTAIAKFESRIQLHPSSTSHPDTHERIKAVASHVRNKTCSDQREDVVAFLEEYDRILCALKSFVAEILNEATSAKPNS